MLVQDTLHHSTERYPDKVALVCDGLRLTYSEIDQAANRLANALIDHGVRRGDRVAIYLPNSVPAVIGIYATLKAGAVFAVVNATTREDKLAYIFNNCAATAIITDARGLSLLEKISGDIPSVKCAIVSASQELSQEGMNGLALLDFKQVQAIYSDSRPEQVNIDLDLACLIYTSGSTGDPKGVMSDHSNMIFAARSITTYLRNVPEDIVINVLPLSFDYGLYQLIMVFLFSGTLVLERSFAYPSAILQRMEVEKVTGFPGVPTVFSLLLKIDLTPYDLSCLRYLSNTAAALPVSHIQQIRQKFPWATLYSMYGLTETKRTLYLPPDQLDIRPDSVGIAIPGTEVWLVDEQGNRLPPGSTGELVVRGRHVMRGYWNDPEATLKRYRPGTLPGERLCYTGDIFRMDSEGYLYFLARKDDVIKSRGEKVPPKEVENVLYAIPGVIEAAVIGVDDPILGQAIKAFLVLDGVDLTEAEVLRYCRSHMEDFMVPHVIEFREELPKTSSGKVTKQGLK
jgi:long-chain acyl-CoA synthetase